MPGLAGFFPPLLPVHVSHALAHLNLVAHEGYWRCGRERYGGLRGYLDYIGFGRDAQMKLAKLLAPRPGSQL